VIYLFSKASKPPLGLTQLLVQWVPASHSVGIKWPRCEADHSELYGATIKTSGGIHPFLQYTFVICKGIIVTLVAAHLFAYCHTGHFVLQNIMLLQTICTSGMVRNFNTYSSLAFVLQQVTVTETDCIHSAVGRDLGT